MRIYFKDCNCEATNLQLNEVCNAHDIVKYKNGKGYVNVTSKEDTAHWLHYINPQHRETDTYGNYFEDAYQKISI